MYTIYVNEVQNDLKVEDDHVIAMAIASDIVVHFTATLRALYIYNKRLHCAFLSETYSKCKGNYEFHGFWHYVHLQGGHLLTWNDLVVCSLLLIF